MSKEKKPLSSRERAFVREYLVSHNAKESAIRAGYSKKSAISIGHNLLRRKHVAKAIAAAEEEIARRAGVSAVRVLEELARVAFADAGDFVEFGPNGIKLRDSKHLEEEQTRAIAEVRRGKVKLHDKLKALELLGKHLGMYTDKVEAVASVDINSQSTVTLYVPDNGRGPKE